MTIVPDLDQPDLLKILLHDYNGQILPENLSRDFALPADMFTIPADSITSVELAPDAVTAAEIAADAVGTSEIAADAVTASEIAADAVGASEIAANAVGSSELADNAVDTAAIQDASVTAAKLASDVLPAGMVVPYVGASAPTGWLECDGASYLRATYPNLFTALGGTSSPYGLPDGTHFNVPDLRGRVIVGPDDMGSGDAGRLSANQTLGASSGAEKHTLATSEIPSHSHGGATGATDPPNHNHDMSYVGIPAGGGAAVNAATFGGGPGMATGYKNQNGSHTHTVSAEGGGGQHNNMQPFLVIGYIVKI